MINKDNSRKGIILIGIAVSLVAVIGALLFVLMTGELRDPGELRERIIETTVQEAEPVNETPDAQEEIAVAELDSESEVELEPENHPETTVSESVTPKKIELPKPEVVSGNEATDIEDGSEEEIDRSYLDNIPEFTDRAYLALNNNLPGFTEKQKESKESFEEYSDLDSLGRCGPAFANVGKDIMPTEERGEIGDVEPSGWHTVKYNDLIDGNYLYNRCHLIGYQLTGENANEKNLITGTRFLNVTVMLPFEKLVADYIRLTGNHVLYRVTPIFKGDNLVASGVLMEAWSVEDSGAGVCFNVYCYNVQPGVIIDYKTGESERDLDYEMESSATKKNITELKTEGNDKSSSTSTANNSRDYEIVEEIVTEVVSYTYIANTNPDSMKFHMPNCESVYRMAEKNKLYFDGDRQELLEQGFEPCKICNP